MPEVPILGGPRSLDEGAPAIGLPGEAVEQADAADEAQDGTRTAS
jgi:hypothetical protein